jgi:hypothetical protein
MNDTTEMNFLNDAIARIESADKSKMTDADALRAMRTLSHLEARKVEIFTGRKAGAW